MYRVLKEKVAETRDNGFCGSQLTNLILKMAWIGWNSTWEHNLKSTSTGVEVACILQTQYTDHCLSYEPAVSMLRKKLGKTKLRISLTN